MGEATTLGRLVERGILLLGDGYRTKRSEHGSPGFRILRVADVENNRIRAGGGDFVREEFARFIGSKLSEPGDVLLTTKGTVGRVAIVGPEMEQVVYSPQLCYLRVRDESVVDRRFLAFWLKSEAFTKQAAHHANNTDMAPYISLGDLRSVRVDLPKVERQRAIAEVLGALDDKIAANERVNGASEALAVALVESAPRATRVSELATQSTQSVSPNGFDERVAHFSLPSFDDGGRPDLAAPSSIKSNKFLIERPAVLISKLNPRIPRVWDVVQMPDQMALASTEFVVLHPTGLSTTALWGALRQSSVTAVLGGKVAGTSGSHQRVRPAEILQLQVPDPRTLEPRVLQRVDSLGGSIHAVRVESVRLAATRDELLPLLMSGRLHVKDAEKVVAEVV